MYQDYDRGHMAPAANHSKSNVALRATFVYSNVCPQLPDFNRGIWKNLEEHIREIAKTSKDMWIITAPLYENFDTRIGKHNIIVPTHFAKSILVKKPDDTLLIKSWLIPHQSKLKNFGDYVVTTDVLEIKLGLNLWSALDDSIEKDLESKVN